MNSEILKTVLEEASELTASLPQGVQEVAFAKAFDVLLEERAGVARHQRSVERRKLQASTHAGRARGGVSHRVGPKLALGQLLDRGYFASSRSVPEIQAHLRDSYGRDYSSNELSISLLRLIRDGRLSRERNLVGQYEYSSGEPREQRARAEPLKHAKPHARLLRDGNSMK